MFRITLYEPGRINWNSSNRVKGVWYCPICGKEREKYFYVPILCLNCDKNIPLMDRLEEEEAYRVEYHREKLTL